MSKPSDDLKRWRVLRSPLALRLSALLVPGAFLFASRTLALEGAADAAHAALACSVFLLTAFGVGALCARLGLPRLTGYLVTGVVMGPEGAVLISDAAVEDLRIFPGAAIALIALTAGSEISLRSLRPLLRSVGWITVVGVIGTAALLSGAAFVAAPYLPFTASFGTVERLAIAAVLGVTMVTASPAVAVALRDELEADGPVSRTVLGVVVIADLVVILLFAVTSALAKSVFGSGPEVAETAVELGWEIGGSCTVGVAAGFVLSLALRAPKLRAAPFVVAAAIVLAEGAQRTHLDPLLVALAAGLFVRNLTTVGDRLRRAIADASVPVYVVFFALAGATVQVEAFAVVGIPAALFALVRAAGYLATVPVAARLARAPVEIQRWAAFGLLPQAGLALALAMLFARTFPEFGADAATMIFGVVALNEAIAPVLYRLALVHSGEVGRRRAPVTDPAGQAPGSATPAPRLVTAYFRGGVWFFEPRARSTLGAWLSCEPVETLLEPSPDTKLGAVLTGLLELAPQENVPHPPERSGPRSALLAKAGVSSWKSFSASARACDVALENGTLRLSPCQRRGQAFLPLRAEQITVTWPVERVSLARELREAFRRCV